MSNYIPAKWEELEIGKTFYMELVDCQTHKPMYLKVVIQDLEEKKVIYKYEDGWKEYQTKSNFKEIGLWKEDKQLKLFEI